MKRTTLPIVIFVVAFCSTTVLAQGGSAVLYSANKYGKEKYPTPNLTFCLDFMRGASGKRMEPCDLRYGSLYVGDDWDWFQSSSHKDSRSLIRDLGQLSWHSEINVPFITPLPKLSPGQQRTITIDSSGADGADGAPGKQGEPGKPGANADGSYPEDERPLPKPSASPGSDTNIPKSTRKKNDGVPKMDPIFVKAIAGHMYAIRVVDEKNDFYALFRVDTIKRGDFVEVSWKIVEAPPEPGKQE